MVQIGVTSDVWRCNSEEMEREVLEGTIETVGTDAVLFRHTQL